MSKNALEIAHLTVNYDKTTVLWDISFSLLPGKLLGILGPNGAGKSTLLKAVIGMVRPISGRIALYGEPFKKSKTLISYIPQKGEVDWDFPMTVFDGVLMGRYAHLGFLKWARKADREAAKRVLHIVGLEDLASRQISQLSGGQQQRLFIARALLQDAKIYLLDEPFAGIDFATEKIIIDLLKKLTGEGKTVIVVHHDLSSVESYFDSALILNTSLIAYGDVKKVFNTENIQRAFGNRGVLFNEAAKLSQKKAFGI